MPDTPARRKARGAFFTPEPLARFCTEWAVRRATDRVYEPSCGEAVFLTQAVRRLRQLGARTIGPTQLAGTDLHGPSVSETRRLLAGLGVAAALEVEDFFETRPRPDWDAVIGNPPYIRYQDFSGEARAKALEAALQQGVNLSRLASSWAAFTVHAARLVAPRGRLALVLPAELLTTNYAAEVRAFLLRRFAMVRLVLFRERVFPDVQEEVVLLLAEGTGPTDHFLVHQADDTEALADADALVWTRSEASPDERWMPALLTPSTMEVYDQLLVSERFVGLESWGDTTLGAVTGNNEFFTLSQADVDQAGLDGRELLPLSPPGSKHLRGLTFGVPDWRRLRDGDERVWLFRPPGEPSDAARALIAAGERAGVHEAYKCRMRTPWWRVPLPAKPDVFVTYMNADTPRLAANHAGVHALNSVHGLTLVDGRKRLGKALLPLATLNSVTLLGAEMVGRAYGGGMLKLEPREADRLPVPSPEAIEAVAPALRELRGDAARLLARGRLPEAVELVDAVLLDVTEAELRRLRDGRELLHSRRRVRGSGRR